MSLFLAIIIGLLIALLGWIIFSCLDKLSERHSELATLILVIIIGLIIGLIIFAISTAGGSVLKTSFSSAGGETALAHNPDICPLSAVLCVGEAENPASEEQIRKIAIKNNFNADYLIALAFCESSLNPYAVGDNGKSRGLFQIHKGYHPEITDEQAFSAEFSTQWVIDKINAGGINQWSCAEKI